VVGLIANNKHYDYMIDDTTTGVPEEETTPSETTPETPVTE